MDSTSPHSLKGKVAIITGSSSGIGAAIAEEFVHMGACVTLHGRNEDNLRNVAKQCEKLGTQKPLMIIGDVTKEEVRVKLINDTVKHFGRLDILVNNAGYGVIGDFSNVDISGLDNMLDIHIRVPAHLTKLAIPQLSQNKGNIINISSVASKRCFPEFSDYSIAKAGMDQLTKCTAMELGSKGVRANSINPGLIATNFAKAMKLPKEVLDSMPKRASDVYPLKRIGMPEEVGRLAGFLASDAASFITGSIMPIDGGYWVVPPLSGRN